MIALTGAYAVVLGLYGTPEWGPIYSGYLGLALLASTLVSLGLAVSALTSNQVIAAIVTIGHLVPALDARHAGRDAARRPRAGLHQPVAAGAFHAIRDRRDVHSRTLGFFISTTSLALFIAMRALARR